MNKPLFNFVKISVLTFVLFFSLGEVVAQITTSDRGPVLPSNEKNLKTQQDLVQEKSTVDKIVNFVAPRGSVLATMFPSTKNCNYVDNKLYQPFSGIDKTFPGANGLGIKELEDRNNLNEKVNVTCIDVSTGGVENILKIFFTLLISIIIIMSVINISISGIQFMTEEASGQIKGGARKRLQNSFIALGLGLLSYTILYTVNRQLVAFNFNPESIDKDGSIEKGIESAEEAAGKSPFSTAVGSIEALQPSTPNSPYLIPPGSQGGLLGTYNSPGVWDERVTENWVRSLPNGQRSTDGRLVVTVYSASKDNITDSNTRAKRGNKNNLLREGSVALSPDLISKYYPQTGQEIFINGISIGFYEDATAASYNGVTFNNTVDIYDENGTLGGSYLKNIPAGQWTIGFGKTKRAQISNP